VPGLPWATHAVARISKPALARELETCEAGSTAAWRNVNVAMGSSGGLVVFAVAGECEESGEGDREEACHEEGRGKNRRGVKKVALSLVSKDFLDGEQGAEGLKGLEGVFDM